MSLEQTLLEQMLPVLMMFEKMMLEQILLEKYLENYFFRANNVKINVDRTYVRIKAVRKKICLNKYC
jgi:hypothetical protein